MTDIIGHESIRRTLSEIASADVLPHHAFFFTGPEGVGKAAVAREFARNLLGRKSESLEGAQDFLSLAPEEGEHREKKISVEAIRAASVFLSRFPVESKRRVLLVDRAEYLSEQAQNALLKIFEEPNESSVIILVASRFGSVRDTVISRSFRITFPLVPEAIIREGAKRIFGEAAIGSLEPFFFSLGRPSIIASAIGDPKAFSKRRDVLRSLFRLSALPFHERLRLSETLSADVRETIMLFEWWATGLRALRKEDMDGKRLRRYYVFLEDIEECMRGLRETNANARLSIDRLFLSI